MSVRYFPQPPHPLYLVRRLAPSGDMIAAMATSVIVAAFTAAATLFWLVRHHLPRHHPGFTARLGSLSDNVGVNAKFKVGCLCRSQRSRSCGYFYLPSQVLLGFYQVFSCFNGVYGVYLADEFSSWIRGFNFVLLDISSFMVCN